MVIDDGLYDQEEVDNTYLNSSDDTHGEGIIEEQDGQFRFVL